MLQLIKRRRGGARTNHEMDFADRLTVARGAMAVAVDATERLLADDHGPSLNLAVEDELIRAVDLVV